MKRMTVRHKRFLIAAAAVILLASLTAGLLAARNFRFGRNNSGLDFPEDLNKLTFLPPYYTDFRENAVRVATDILSNEKGDPLTMDEIALGTRARAHVKRHGEEEIDEIDRVIVYTEEYAAQSPTGMYGVGQPMLMVQGRLYNNPQKMAVAEPPAGEPPAYHELLGSVRVNSAEHPPQQDFDACHITPVSEIYWCPFLDIDVLLVHEGNQWFSMTPLRGKEKIHPKETESILNVGVGF